jgi:hypothetical protein
MPVVTQLRRRKEIRVVGGDLYLSSDVEVKGVVPCNSLQNEVHKRGICRHASYAW